MNLSLDEIKKIYPEIPLGKAKNLRGKNFGRLTPLYRTTNQNTNSRWVCLCECGKIKEYYTNTLTSGKTLSCGCYHKDKSRNSYKDITNQKFGHLTAIEPIDKNKQGIIWRCKCDCGNECSVQGVSLRAGNTKSCGCSLSHLKNRGPKKNLAGQQFSKLKVLRATEKRRKGCVLWECQCECGALVYHTTADLRSGHVKSCGCMKSYGEYVIANILSQNNIHFIKNYVFKNCKNYKFDFYLPDYNYCIEYDGEQHFFSREKGWNTKEHLKETQRRDQFKNEWCKNNNVPLIRIPYIHLKNIVLTDLIVEHTRYRVV